MTLLAYFVGHSSIQCPKCSKSHSYPLSQITNREELPLGELEARIIGFLKGEGWDLVDVLVSVRTEPGDQLWCPSCIAEFKAERPGGEG